LKRNKNNMGWVIIVIIVKMNASGRHGWTAMAVLPEASQYSQQA
jgi:hypothetical protein